MRLVRRFPVLPHQLRPRLHLSPLLRPLSRSQHQQHPHKHRQHLPKRLRQRHLLHRHRRLHLRPRPPTITRMPPCASPAFKRIDCARRTRN